VKKRKFRQDRALKTIVAAIAAITLVGGCEQADAPIAGPASMSPPAAVRRYVTGDAAAALNSSGRFAFAAPSPPDSRPIITPGRAAELALASVRTWGPSFREEWVAERGRSFDFQSLTADSRILFVKSPYGRFPDGYHPAYARLYGPYYIVQLKSGSATIMLVSVSAYATDVKIDGRGIVHRPVERGMEFVHQILPEAHQDWFVSPEAAVERVGRETGARIDRRPELVRINKDNIPSSAVWKLSLDRDVDVKPAGRGTPLRTRELYVATARGAPLMMPGSKTGGTEPGHVLVSEGRNLRAQAIQVPILDGEFTLFNPVGIAGGL
jgi:hypothetical protein